MKAKICIKCNTEKDISLFDKRKDSPSGVRSDCKECRAIYSKNYRLNNFEKIKNGKQNYHQNNKEAISKRNKEYRMLNAEKIKVHRTEYYKNNKKEILEKRKTSYLSNKDVVIMRSNIWYKNNKQQCLVTRSKNNKKRYDSDYTYRLKKNMRSRVNLALKGQNKGGSTESLVGCSTEYLKSYLESKFVEGMGWENRSKWHIDHIRPCSSFDLSDPEQQKLCFHYTNLQPLWAKDNLKKSNKLNFKLENKNE